MKTALIFGRARGVWDEMVEARKLRAYDYVIAVGKSGCDYPGYIDHWVSFHAELFEKWHDARRRQFFPMSSIMLWTAVMSGRRRAARCHGALIGEVECLGGSSGLIAVRVAQKQLKVERIVLAGIPMEPSRGHYDEAGDWDEGLIHWKIWEQAADELKPIVRSMSGRTREVFGSPDINWLSQE